MAGNLFIICAVIGALQQNLSILQHLQQLVHLHGMQLANLINIQHTAMGLGYCARLWLRNSRRSHGAGALIHKLSEEGKITEEMFVTLPQLAAHQKPGRESEDELCVCCTYGIGSVDVAVANQIYENALEKGIGQKLMLWDNPLWV